MSGGAPRFGPSTIMLGSGDLAAAPRHNKLRSDDLGGRRIARLASPAKPAPIVSMTMSMMVSNLPLMTSPGAILSNPHSAISHSAPMVSPTLAIIKTMSG